MRLFILWAFVVSLTLSTQLIKYLDFGSDELHKYAVVTWQPHIFFL